MPSHQGWLHLISDSTHAGRRHYLELGHERSSLRVFADANHVRFAEPSIGEMRVEDIVAVERMSDVALRELAQQRAPLSDLRHFTIEVRLEPGEPLGLQIDPTSLKVVRFSEGSAAEQALTADPAAQVHDRVFAIDGMRLDSNADVVKVTRRGTQNRDASRHKPQTRRGTQRPDAPRQSSNSWGS